MKITYIFGNMTHYDHGLAEILKRTKNVFAELDAETDAIDLGALHPPYYDGETTSAIDKVMEKLKSANGIIFACTAQIFSPTALMQNFLEYFEHSEYADVLKNKHCMIVLLSREGGEKSAMDYFTRTLQNFGGFVASQIALQTKHLDEIETDAGEFIDKATEDFFRAVHKNRKYFIPADFTTKEIIIEKTVVVEKPAEEKKPTKQLENFSDAEEKEIEELSFLFTKKHAERAADAEEKSSENDVAHGTKRTAREEILHGERENSSREKKQRENILKKSNESTTRSTDFEKSPQKTQRATDSQNSSAKITHRPENIIQNELKKLTEDLPNRFQPHLSAGLQAAIQINISGEKKFDGVLRIHSTECTYSDGTTPDPDIIIMADSAVWLDVLTGKSTAQKAFMIGGIKVRGDFVLLTKFDTLFTK